MIASPTPKIIGICGHPQHGKTTAQEILQTVGVRPVDDSKQLRILGMRKWNLTWDQVSTQEGKASLIEAYGQIMTVREALGLLGKESERDYGENVWMDRAIAEVLETGDRTPVAFGSVRMNQGAAVKAAGGIVIEIVNPAKERSPHDFDQYRPDNVDITVINDGLISHLRWKLINRTWRYLGLPVKDLLDAAVAYRMETPS